MFVTNKLITIRLDNSRSYKQGLHLKYISFHTKHSHLGKAWPRIILQVSGNACGCQRNFGRNNVPLQSTFTPQPGSAYSTPGFNRFTQIQIIFSHTDIVKYQSRYITSPQTRFTLPTENPISLSFIIVAHNRLNIVLLERK